MSALVCLFANTEAVNSSIAQFMTMRQRIGTFEMGAISLGGCAFKRLSRTYGRGCAVSRSCRTPFMTPVTNIISKFKANATNDARTTQLGTWTKHVILQRMLGGLDQVHSIAIVIALSFECTFGYPQLNVARCLRSTRETMNTRTTSAFSSYHRIQNSMYDCEQFC